MRVKASELLFGLFFSFAIALAGCGGAGSGGATPTKSMVSGTASEGALITGKTVKLKDANGNSATDTTTDATTGGYSIDVTGLAAPFLITVTGSNGTYLTFAPTAGKANINPITTTVVALAAGTPDMPSLFAHLTPAQLTSINGNFSAKSAMVTTSLQAALPAGVRTEDYFTGTVIAGKGMDAVFDTYQIAIDPTNGIVFFTKDGTATTVLSIPVSTVTGNTTQPLPLLVPPVAPISGGTSAPPLPPPPPPPLQLPEHIMAKIYLSGLPVARTIGAVEFKINLPANAIPVTVDSTNDAKGSIEISSAFAADSSVSSHYVQATDTTAGSLHIMIVDVKGLQQGEIATIALEVPTGITPTVTDFTISDVFISDLNGNVFNVATVAVSSLVLQ